MLNPIITEYIIADRAEEARQHAEAARFARSATDGAESPVARTTRRRRAWGWSLTPRSFGSARLLTR